MRKYALLIATALSLFILTFYTEAMQVSFLRPPRLRKRYVLRRPKSSEGDKSSSLDFITHHSPNTPPTFVHQRYKALIENPAKSLRRLRTVAAFPLLFVACLFLIHNHVYKIPSKQTLELRNSEAKDDN